MTFINHPPGCIFYVLGVHDCLVVVYQKIYIIIINHPRGAWWFFTVSYISAIIV